MRRPGTRTLEDPLAHPRWTRTQQVMVSIVTLGVLIVLGVLVLSLRTVSTLEQDLRASDDVAEQFIAVMREAGRLEVDVLTAETLADEDVQLRAGVLSRHVAVLRSRLGDDTVSLADSSDVATVAELHALLVSQMETTSSDTGAITDTLSRIERVSKAAADRAETARRGLLVDQVDAAHAVASRTLVISIVVVLLAAVLLSSVRRRFRSAYARAHETAVERARELSRSNEELRAANETKQRFVSMVSHELRTPLTVIRGFAETLAHHSHLLSEEQRDELAAAIVRQSLRQQRMVEDLLVAARHADQGPTAAPAPVSVTELVTRVSTDLLADVPDGLTVEWGEEAVVWADPHHAEQVLENLLTNAGKYGGTRTWVRWSTEDDTLKIVVEDDGPGVPDEFVDALFLPFSQADDGDTRASRGVGLGLTITQTLIEANGGTISYRHRHGGGAHFAVRLPLAEQASASEGTVTSPAAASAHG